MSQVLTAEQILDLVSRRWPGEEARILHQLGLQALQLRVDLANDGGNLVGVDPPGGYTATNINELLAEIAALGSMGPPGPAVQVLDEGVSLTLGAASLNFIGAGVAASASGANITINIPGGAGGVAWGAITGTLSNQTDLQTALNGKQATLGFTPLNAASVSAFGLTLIDDADAATARTTLGAQAALGFTPLNSTAVSAFGLTLIDDVDATAARSTLGLGTAATAAAASFQPVDATLTALAAANWAANALPIGSGADTLSQVAFAANTFPGRSSTGNLAAKAITDFGFSLLDDVDAATARATLGAQASLGFTPLNATAVSAFGLTLIDDVDAATARATLGAAAASHTHVAADITDFNSVSRAQIEAALIAGANVTITPAGSGATRTFTIAASGGGGGSLTVQDEGSTLTAAATSINFTGAGVSASNSGGDVTVVITGGGGGSALAGAATVTMPRGRTHTQVITATGVTPASIVSVALAPTTDADQNTPEMLSPHTIQATPGTNQITVTLAFSSIESGPIKLNWSAL